MRQVSLKFVPTAILSRQVAVIRKQALIINLPGQPKAIRETLEGLKDESGKTIVSGIFAAVPYCIDLIGGPYIETNDDVVKAFRPKSAIRPRKVNMAQKLLEAIEIETGPKPGRERHLDARPRRGRQRLRADRARARSRRRARHPLRLSARADAAGDDQQRLRHARVVRREVGRSRRQVETGGRERRARVAGRDRAAHRARDLARHRRGQDRARRLFTRRRGRAADRLALSAEARRA